MTKHDGGKGDLPRPLGVDMETFDKNFEAIFGRKADKPAPEVEPIPFAGMVDIEKKDD